MPTFESSAYAEVRTLQVKLIKIGAKVIKHSGYVIFQMAEVMVSRSLFCDILERIGQLKAIPITPEPG
ncbi:MAG: transposase [Planctomycetota bacterium]